MSTEQQDWLDASATKTLDLEQMDALVEKSVAAWAKYDEAKAISSALYAEAERVDAQIMTTLKDAGKSKYFVDDVGTISVVQKAVVTVPKTIEAKHKFFEYLKSLGEEVYLAMATVNSNSLNSWFSEKLEEASAKGILGFSVPGIDDPTTRESLRFTAVRKVKNG
jgi:hypothetical protein